MKEKLPRECYAISSRDMALGRAYVLGEDISRPTMQFPHQSPLHPRFHQYATSSVTTLPLRPSTLRPKFHHCVFYAICLTPISLPFYPTIAINMAPLGHHLTTTWPPLSPVRHHLCRRFTLPLSPPSLGGCLILIKRQPHLFLSTFSCLLLISTMRAFLLSKESGHLSTRKRANHLGLLITVFR